MLAVAKEGGSSAGTPTRPIDIVLMDGEAPWVQALFAAMPTDVTIHSFRPKGLAAAIRSPLDAARGWRQITNHWWERSVLIPSWSKARRLTSGICEYHLRRRLEALGGDTTIVYTLPYYSRLAAKLGYLRQVYFAYDPYQYYTGWDSATVVAGERELLAQCDAAFAISLPLADDFRTTSHRPVFVQPNGVSEAFLAAFDEPMPPPADLPLGGPPIVGCVGQISRAYDWDLLADLVCRCPAYSFVFVGPLFPEGPTIQAKVDRVFNAKNVRWLGPKPHAELPLYINRFAVCLNPLRVNPCNDRRSLLRFYDYLASDRPIVSTAVVAAFDHRPHIEIGRDTAELAALLSRLTAGDHPIDRDARRRYIRGHTWERRAETFLTNLRSVIANRPA